jgi:hypothetical protein
LIASSLKKEEKAGEEKAREEKVEEKSSWWSDGVELAFTKSGGSCGDVIAQTSFPWQMRGHEVKPLRPIGTRRRADL